MDEIGYKHKLNNDTDDENSHIRLVRSIHLLLSMYMRVHFCLALHLCTQRTTICSNGLHFDRAITSK